MSFYATWIMWELIVGGVGRLSPVIVTLSKVEELIAEELPLPAQTARPAKMAEPMAMVVGDPAWVQVVPSEDVYPVNTLPTRVTLTQ